MGSTSAIISGFEAPPAVPSSALQAWTGLPNGNGTYAFYASTENGDRFAYKGFKWTGSAWHSLYGLASYDASGRYLSISNLTGTYMGEYIGMRMPVSLGMKLTSYRFNTTSTIRRIPTDWRVFGRLNRGAWVELDRREGQDLAINTQFKATLSNPSESSSFFNEFAVVFGRAKETSDGSIQLLGLAFTGELAQLAPDDVAEVTMHANVSVPSTLKAGKLDTNNMTCMEILSPSATEPLRMEAASMLLRSDIAWTTLSSSIHNVKGFGARGDGTGIDSLAISRALEKIGAQGGGVLYFPRGTYMTGTVKINTHNTCILGDGPGQSIIKMMPGTYAGHVITFANNLNNVGVNGIHVNGTFSQGTLGHGIVFNCGDRHFVKNFKIEDCALYGIGNGGATNEFARNLLVSDGHIMNIGSDGIDGKKPAMDGAYRVYQNLIIENFGLRNPAQAGIDIRGKAIVSNVCVRNFGAGHAGIRFRPGETWVTGNGYGAHDGCLTNFQVSNGGTGVEINARYVNVSNGNVRGCEVGIDVGCHSANVSNVSTVDCAIGLRTKAQYYYLYEAGIDLTVSSCSFCAETRSFDASVSYVGVNLMTNRAIITGCKFRNLTCGIQDVNPLIEHPPGDMKAYTDYKYNTQYGIDGSYNVIFSSESTSNGRLAYNAFIHNALYQSAGTYSSITGVYTGSVNLTGDYPGEYVGLRLPHKIKLAKYRFATSSSPNYNPVSWRIYGRDTGSNGSWVLLDSRDNEAVDSTGAYANTVQYAGSNAFDTFAMVMGKKAVTGSYVVIRGIRLFGTLVDAGRNIITQGNMFISTDTNIQTLTGSDFVSNFIDVP